jgi:hypothetical protein
MDVRCWCDKALLIDEKRAKGWNMDGRKEAGMCRADIRMHDMWAKRAALSRHMKTFMGNEEAEGLRQQKGG